MPIYNTKVIQTPHSLELWHYSRPLASGYSKDKVLERRKYEELSGSEKINSYLRRKKYYKDKRHFIRRLVEVNYDERTSFLTLTQRKNNPSAYDVKLSNYEFDKFIRRLKYYLKKHYPDDDLKYLATWERTRAGVIHYHLILFSFPFIPAKTLERIWGLGFIKVNHIKQIDAGKRGLYVSKYFSKDLQFRERKQKAFFRSRNLKNPEEFKFYLDDKKVMLNVFKDKIYHNEYTYFPNGGDQRTVSYYILGLNRKT